MPTTPRVKMVLGGICNLVVIVTFALLLVILSENHVVHRVLAQTELNNNRVVLTTQDAGSFVGKKELVMQDDPNEVQRTYFAFRGIPYSTPPIGELRWAPPQPVELKSTPHQAGDFKPPCSQWSAKKKKVIGAPDCLYLNVFTSFIPSATKRRISGNVTSWTIENPNLLPVLVYIHGGEYLSGSASKYSPDALMKRERVVLVTFNYRLGVLGWLSTGDPSTGDIIGNYGLMDQIAALKWIQKYIHRFGGNPLRVVIYGSVDHLLVANLDAGEKSPQPQLFQAAILRPQSTSMLSPFAKVDSQESAKMFIRQLAENVACKNDDGLFFGDELVDCLRKVDTDSLIRSQTKLLTFHNFPFPFTQAGPLGPVVDNYLLDDDPDVLFTTGKFREVPIMVGLSATEGYNPFLEFYLKMATKRRKGGNKEGTSSTETGGASAENRKISNVTNVLVEGETREMLKNIMETAMSGIPDLEKDGAFDRVFESIWKYYFGGISAKSWGRDVDQVVQKLLRLFADMLVNTGHCKLLHALSLHAKAPVYSYVFSHGINYFPDYFRETRETFESSEGLAAGPKRPKRSVHMSVDTPWTEQYYLFYPVRDLDDVSSSSFYRNSGSDSGNPAITPDAGENSLPEDDRVIMDALAKIWVSFAKYGQPKQAIAELAEYGRWVRLDQGHKSLNYYFISNLSLQRGMRSDFRKAECQFWMDTVPQVRKLSKVIQELEPFPILFWSSIAVVVLFALIIITLIVLIVCAKRKSDSYGGVNNGRYLQSTGAL